jgi:hypothetical protein
MSSLEPFILPFYLCSQLLFVTQAVHMQDSIPRGVIEVHKCLSIKGAEDVINKPHAFEISTTEDSMFFIADSDKVRTHISGSGA